MKHWIIIHRRLLCLRFSCEKVSLTWKRSARQSFQSLQHPSDGSIRSRLEGYQSLHLLMRTKQAGIVCQCRDDSSSLYSRFSSSPSFFSFVRSFVRANRHNNSVRFFSFHWSTADDSFRLYVPRETNVSRARVTSDPTMKDC